MKMKRREFPGTAAAGAAGVLAAGRLAAAPAPSATVPLGKELNVTRIGLGTGMRGWERASNHTRMG